MTYEEYRMRVADDYQNSEMAGDPDGELLKAWVLLPKNDTAIRKFYDRGIPWEDVEDMLGVPSLDDRI